MASVVAITQEDLLAIAPEYMKKVKDNIMGHHIGIDRNLLEEVNLTYLFEPIESSPQSSDISIPDPVSPTAIVKSPPLPNFQLQNTSPQNDPISVFFQDFGNAEPGDGFYIPRSHSVLEESTD